MNFHWPTNDTTRIRTLQGLRSERVDQTLSNKEIDDWLKESVKLVAGNLRGLGANQRRIRYFGFERSNEQDTK
jgi:hypothetical protein